VWRSGPRAEGLLQGEGQALGQPRACRGQPDKNGI